MCDQHQALAQRLAAIYPEAPDFSAVDVHGDSLGMEDFRGSVVAVYHDDSQWRETQARELDTLTSWHDRFHRDGLRVLYLAVPRVYHPGNGRPPYSKRDQIIEAVRGRGYPFTVAFDEDRVAWAQHGSRAPDGRALFAIDRLGRLRLRQVRASDGTEILSQNQEAITLLKRLLEEAEPSASLPPQAHVVSNADPAPAPAPPDVSAAHQCSAQ